MKWSVGASECHACIESYVGLQRGIEDNIIKLIADGQQVRSQSIIFRKFISKAMLELKYFFIVNNFIERNLLIIGTYDQTTP